VARASSALVLRPHGTAFSQSVSVLLDVGELALNAAAAACGGGVAGKDALVALWKPRPDDSPGTPWRERPLDCKHVFSGIVARKHVFSGIVAVASRTFSACTLALRVGSCGPGRCRTAEATAITLSGSCAPGLDGTYVLLPERAGGGPTYGRAAGGSMGYRQVKGYDSSYGPCWCCGPQAGLATGACVVQSQSVKLDGPAVSWDPSTWSSRCSGSIVPGVQATPPLRPAPLPCTERRGGCPYPPPSLP
jgi:hypothetical protein